MRIIKVFFSIFCCTFIVGCITIESDAYFLAGGCGYDFYLNHKPANDLLEKGATPVSSGNQFATTTSIPFLGKIYLEKLDLTYTTYTGLSPTQGQVSHRYDTFTYEVAFKVGMRHALHENLSKPEEDVFSRGGAKYAQATLTHEAHHVAFSKWVSCHIPKSLIWLYKNQHKCIVTYIDKCYSFLQIDEYQAYVSMIDDNYQFSFGLLHNFSGNYEKYPEDLQAYKLVYDMHNTYCGRKITCFTESLDPVLQAFYLQIE